MTRTALQKTIFSPGRRLGSSPSEHRYYVLILFDIVDAKKYRLLMRVINRYAKRIQKSVFEAQLKPKQIREMTESIEKLMAADRYYDPDDNVRIYRIASSCDVTVFGTCDTTDMVSDNFI